jgi:hypothetical protein
MSFKGGSQQPQQSMNAGGENTHVMHHATLYVIHDGQEDGRVSPFTDTIHLQATTFREFSETTAFNSSNGISGTNNPANGDGLGDDNIYKTKNPTEILSKGNRDLNKPDTKLLKIQDRSDLEKLQQLDLHHCGNIHLLINKNWKFEAVRKLPWIFHNQGVTPLFFEANKNIHWQSDKTALRKLHDKGVIMPIDLMAVVRWQTNHRNWLKRVFLGRSKEALEAKAALTLLNFQVMPPYFIYQQDLRELQQWISDGKVMLQTFVVEEISE